MSIEFVTELPARRRTSENRFTPSASVADMLRSNPNRWAVIRKYDKDGKNAGYVFASQCRNGRIKALAPSAGFEVESRLVGDELHIFARFVGA